MNDRELAAERWISLVNSDDRNRQNRNAGNGGDLVKHTVYLTLMNQLMLFEPWRSHIRLRECHAGRGVYLPAPDPEWLVMRLLKDLPDAILARAQATVFDVLGLAANSPGRVYAGSPLLNLLSMSDGARVLAEFYEQKPATRNILRATLNRIPPWPEGFELAVPGGSRRSFDGEEHVERHLPEWDERDVILLDPFAMWRQAKHQRLRDRYRRILEGALERSCTLSLFFTWGNANVQAAEDIAGQSGHIPNGYNRLRELVRGMGAPGIVVHWIWKSAFSMWLLLPNEEIRDAVVERLMIELAILDTLPDQFATTRKYADTFLGLL